MCGARKGTNRGTRVSDLCILHSPQLRGEAQASLVTGNEGGIAGKSE